MQKPHFSSTFCVCGEPGIRMALVFFAGVGGFLLLRMLLPAL